MKKLVAAAFALGLVTAACTGSNAKRDLEGVPSVDPQKATVYNNVDEHPNLAVICIEGVAFVTSTRQYESHERVEALDRTCPGGGVTR